MEEGNATLAESSDEPRRTVRSYFAETCVYVDESVYTWKIRHLLNSYLKISESIDSPVFATDVEEVANLEWSLYFYPNGKENMLEDYAPLILVPLEHDSSREDDVTVYFKWSIVVENKGCFHEEVRHENHVVLTDDSNEYIIERFLKKNEINRFLHNGNLTIRCRVYSYNGAKESNVSPTPLEQIENQTLDQRVRELEDFGKLFENEKFSDVTLAVGKEKFLAHKSVLSVRSRVFEAMFEHNMKENQENLVTIVDVESEVMKEVLRFIYSGKVKNLETLAEGLLAAADKYELNGLKRICEDALIERLSDNTAGEILLLSDRHDAENLRAATIEFITIHANEIASVDSFNEAIKSLSPSLASIVIKTLMLKI